MTRAVSNRDLIDEIRARTDIVEVVSRYVTLKPSGKNLIGLCPFHEEKTPSFTVSPEKGIFYCFGCHAGGDVFSFLMKKEGLSFPDAVTALARQAGVAVSEGRTPGGGAGPRQAVLEALTFAQSFYYRALWNWAGGERCRKYLESRGVTPEVAQRFGLGYAPRGWRALADALRQNGIKDEVALAAGLVARTREHAGQGPRTRLYDVFRDRLMFPIHDEWGRVVAFGGRALSENSGGPKYLNSSETVVFSKGKALYGLYFAREAIRRQGFAVMVEGYMDVITCHQHGFENVVASLGTALTGGQARLLLRYAPKVVIAYDADSAGQAATLRGLDILQGAGCAVRVAEFPEGMDPDELIRSEGGTRRFEDAIAKSVTLMDYKLSRVTRKYDLGDPEQRLSAAREMVAVLAGCGDALERELYTKKVAAVLGFAEETLTQEVDRRAKVGIKKALDKSAVKGHNILDKKKMGNAGVRLLAEAPGRLKAEKELLGLALKHACCAKMICAEIDEKDLVRPAHQRVFKAVKAAMADLAEEAEDAWEGPGVGGKAEKAWFSLPGRLLDELREDAEAIQVVAELATAAEGFLGASEAVGGLGGRGDEEGGDRTGSGTGEVGDDYDDVSDRAMAVARDLISSIRRFGRTEQLVRLSMEIRKHESEGREPPKELVEAYRRVLMEHKGSGAQDAG